MADDDGAAAAKPPPHTSMKEWFDDDILIIKDDGSTAEGAQSRRDYIDSKPRTEVLTRVDVTTIIGLTGTDAPKIGGSAWFNVGTTYDIKTALYKLTFSDLQDIIEVCDAYESVKAALKEQEHPFEPCPAPDGYVPDLAGARKQAR